MGVLIGDVDVWPLIEWLTESHLDTYGGYPHAWGFFGDYFIIADLDAFKERERTELLAWRKADMVEWMKNLTEALNDEDYDEYDYADVVESFRPDTVSSEDVYVEDLRKDLL